MSAHRVQFYENDDVLISALTDQPFPIDSVVMGEIALSGEVRPVSHATLRLKEAAKLGFHGALIPVGSTAPPKGVKSAAFRTLGQLVDHLTGRA